MAPPPPPTSLSPVPEDTPSDHGGGDQSSRDSLVSITEWRRMPPAHLAAAASSSDPNLPYRGRPPHRSPSRTPPNDYNYSNYYSSSGSRTPPSNFSRSSSSSNSSHRSPKGLPRPPRPVSFPPRRTSSNKSPLATEYYSPSPPPSMRGEREFEFFAPIRGQTNLRASEQFYEPPAPGTVTVASSLSEDLDDDGRIPWYRRPIVIAGYVLGLFTIIGVAVALGVVL